MSRGRAAEAVLLAVAPLLLLTGPAHAATPTSSPSPSAVASVSASASPSSGPSLGVSPAVLAAGASAVVTAHAQPGAPVDLYAYTRPSTTLRLVRSGTADGEGLVAWTVRPAASSRFLARSSGTESAPLVLPVARRVSLDGLPAARPGCSAYRGRVYPAAAGAGGVSVVRLVDERRVLVARASVAPDGRWSTSWCPSGYTGDVTVTVQLSRTLTWVDAALPVVSESTSDCSACLPGPDVVVVVDVDPGTATPDRTVTLHRGQGLLVKVVQNSSTGYRFEVRRAGAVLVGPQQSFVPYPPPPPSRTPLAGAPDGRTFSRFVAVRRGTGQVLVVGLPPGDQPAERRLTIGVTVR